MSNSEIIITIIGAVGGLALFIYGMLSMSSSLEKIAGGKIEKMLSSMTENILKGMILGCVITAFVHSSSAVIAITVGLVNAGLLTLKGASGIIIGANIGHCVTPLIIAVAQSGENTENHSVQVMNTIMEFFNISTIASVLVIIGIIYLMLGKSSKGKTTGEIFVGSAVLFFGMDFLSGNVKKFSELESFREVFLTLSNPIWGILFGIVFTAIIQSSTAATAVLQSFAIQGLVPFPAAFALLLGFNIGTTSTGLLASIGTGKNARRTSVMHVCFNVIAVIFCFTLLTVLNKIFQFSWWNNSTSSLWIALIGLFVNVAAALLFLPFPKLLPKLAMFFMPDKASDIVSEEEELSDSFANVLDRRFVMSPSIAIQQAQNTVVKMGELAKTNLEKALELYKTYSKKTLENINKREEIIDSLEDKLNEYLVMITEKSLSDVENRSVTALLRLLIEFERIGDYAINIAERAEYMHSKNMSFSDTAEDDFQQLGVAIQEITQMAITAVGYSDLDTVMNIEPLEQTIDQIVDKIRERHIGRLKEGICTIDRGITFLNNIADMERVSDHCSNIAVYVLGKLAQKDIVDRHNYIDRMHKGEIPGYSEKLAEYMAKYSV